MRYFAPLRCRALVNIAQCSKLTSWEFRVVYFGQWFAILLAWIARQRANASRRWLISPLASLSCLRQCEAVLLFRWLRIASIRAATFWPVPELQMPGQPNRDYRYRCGSVLSCHRPYCGTRRSLCSWPIASDFIASAFTCASWIRPHLVHRRVQCSNPARAEVICWISMRDWHLGQRGRPATRGDRLDVCGSGNRCPPVKSGGSATDLSPMGVGTVR